MKVSVQISAPLAREYQQEVIKNIYWIDPDIAEAAYQDGSDEIIEIEYKGANFPESTRQETEELALHIIRSIERLQIRIIFDQTDLHVPYQSDPLPDLQASGAVTPLLDGGYAYSGIALKLMTGLDRAFREYALSLSSQEFSFPGLLSYDAARRCGYLESYPQHVNLVCHVHEDLDSLRGFRESAQKSQPPGSDHSFKHLETAEAILPPTICHHFWHSLADSVRPLDSLVIGTAVGPCYRFEGRATTGLERLRGFQMREVFAIGPPTEVVPFRDRLLKDQADFLQRFAIAGKIETASDPFFVDDYSAKRLFQVGLELKHEVRAALPYSRSLLAIGSVNYHQDYFSKAFDIKSQSGGPVHSCCLGFGLDRWCLVILAQYGLDPAQWPGSLQELIQH